MNIDDKKELARIRGLRDKLKRMATNYIKENGLEAFLDLPPFENFTLNAPKFNRLQELEMMELEDKLFNEESYEEDTDYNY